MVLTLNGKNRKNMCIELLKRESPMCSPILKLANFFKKFIIMFPVSLLFYFEEVCFLKRMQITCFLKEMQPLYITFSPWRL